MNFYLTDKSTEKTFSEIGQRQNKTVSGSNAVLEGFQLAVKLVTGEAIKIEYKRSLHQRLRPLQARMGHGSPLCAKLHERIVSQLKDNVFQRKEFRSFTTHSS